MKKKAIISVSSKQKDIEDDTIEVVTPGNFYEKEGYYYAVYKETEISGMEGTTTTLKMCKDRFILTRMGSTSAKMEFNKNLETVSMYNTKYGTLELKIETKDLEIDVNDNGGDIQINYFLSIGGQSPQNTLLKINIKTQ